jgi:hypothetical protein
MISQHHLLLICGFLTAPDVTSFSIPAAQHLLSIRSKETISTVLFASATESYLDSLNAIVEKQSGGFLTNDYLNGLSPAVDASSSSVSPEEYLINLPSQLAEAAKATGSNLDLGGLYLADSEIADASASASSSLALDSSASLALDSSASLTMDSSASLAMDSSASLALDSNTASSIGEGLTNSLTTNAADSLSSQLSGLSYGSFVDEKITNGAGQADIFSDLAASSSASLNAATSEITEKVGAQANKLLGSVRASVEASIDEVGGVFKAVPKVVEAGTTSIANVVVEKGTASANAVTASLEAEKSAIIQTTTATAESVGKETISDLADGIMYGLKTIGAFLSQVLDAILKELAGTTMGELIQIAQQSVDTAISGAVNSVTTTLNDFGNMTMTQLVQAFIAMLVTVSKFLFTVLNEVVKLVSGKEASEWALAASGTINQKTGELTAQAASTATDLTHKSLAELSTNVGAFSQDIGKQVVASVGVLGDAVVTQVGSDGVSMASSTIDSVSAAVQMSQLL